MTMTESAVIGKPVRRTVRQLYRPIDIHSSAPAWPAVVPALTEAEAIAAGKRLFRRFYQDRWYKERRRPVPRKQTAMPVKVTSGNRNNWVRRGVIYVNPGAGWKTLVHDLSHYCHWRLRPKDKPHSDNHRHLEWEMIAYVVESGWLDGKLRPKARPPKPKVDPVAAELAKVQARLKAWETKLKRATTMVIKLRREEKRLARKRPLFTL